MSEFNRGNYWMIEGDTEEDRLNFITQVVEVLELDGWEREDYLLNIEDSDWEFIIIADDGYICVGDALDSYTSNPCLLPSSLLFKSTETQSTDGLQSDLEEAYAKIDTLESALEDAVKRLYNWRNGRNESYRLEDEESKFKPTEFKPIDEMTMEDWELAKEEDWVFEANNGKLDTVEGIDYSDNTYPVCFKTLRWKTQSGYDTYFEDDRREYDVNIIKRIK